MDYQELLKNLRGSSLPPELLAKVAELGGNRKDPLTGVWDYRSFLSRLRADTADGGRFSLVAVCLDYIQEINLISGWIVGDLALCGVATLLDSTPCGAGEVGRVSGAKFIYRSDELGMRALREWLQTLRQEVAKLNIPGADMLPDECLTLSAGIYVAPPGGDADKAVGEAHARLETARSLGGGKISVIASGQRLAAKDVQGLVVSLRDEAGNHGGEPALLLELSVNGLSAAAPSPWLVRKLVTATLSGDRLPETLHIPGEVAWRKPADGEGAPADFIVGIKFGSMDEDRQDILAGLISATLTGRG